MEGERKGGAYLMAPPGKLSMMFWHTLSSHPTCGNPSLSLLSRLDRKKIKWMGENAVEQNRIEQNRIGEIRKEWNRKE
jgi:hypothetical protein